MSVVGFAVSTFLKFASVATYSTPKQQMHSNSRLGTLVCTYSTYIRNYLARRVAFSPSPSTLDSPLSPHTTVYTSQLHHTHRIHNAPPHVHTLLPRSPPHQHSPPPLNLVLLSEPRVISNKPTLSLQRTVELSYSRPSLPSPLKTLR